MPDRCVAGNCSNVAKDGVSLHYFPTDPILCKKWVKAVQRSRVWDNPTSSSVLCSEHFDKDCFELSCLLQKELGFKSKVKLKPNSVPAIFKTKQEVKVREASRKRQRKMVVEEIIQVYSTSSVTQTDKVTETMDVCDPEGNVRQTTMKNGNSRCTEVTNENSSDFALEEPMFDEKTTKSVYIQAYPAQLKNKCVQTHRVPPNMVSKEIQTEVPVANKGIQVGDSFGVSSSCESEDDTGNDNKDIDYIPSEHSEDETCEDNINFNKSTRNLFSLSNTGNVNVHKEPKYIVFLSMLYKLISWLHCPDCGKTVISKAAKEWGTLLVLSICCVECGSINEWYSQPFIANIPAGNILLSAAILYSGSIPAKSFKMLSHLGVKSISKRTFFRHQRLILHPAINRVWQYEKDKNYERLHRENRFLVLGGDGRCDSPGHCAKYGTYTIMELDANLILETQVFTVCKCFKKAKSCI